jgi:methyltransferase-like protein/SAM-dependent methyltransferase
MNSKERTGYDIVPYPSTVYPQTHPDRLATIASLCGLKPAPVARARVLELGCGDGTNAITMALSLPESSFTGIDLAADPIARGNETIKTLGLTNVTLRQMNLLEAPADLGTFDYILCHGVYSWVPAEVRDKILAVCGAHLSEQGIAYVSYNAHPGNHLRDLVRHMMRYHVQNFPEPADKIKQARALVKFASEAREKPDLWQAILQRQTERISGYTDTGFFHDDLAEINHPVYFHEFAEHAGRHGLQYLSEADLADMLQDGLTESATAMLNQLNEQNVVIREQYLDFVRGRSFRQTLLCRHELTLDRALDPSRVPDFVIAADARPVKPDLDVTQAGNEDFNGPKKAVIATGVPLLKGALVHLGTLFPQTIPFPELLAAARERCGHRADGDGSSEAEDNRTLADFLVRCYAMGFVELHAHAFTFVTHVSERPTASPLVRLQLQRGSLVSSLRHTSLRIEDSFGRQLVRLCDGTRDHAALAAELTEALRTGAATLEHEGKPVTDLQEAGPIIARELQKNLQNIAKLGLLVA